jgi:hypothetical protein
MMADEEPSEISQYITDDAPPPKTILSAKSVKQQRLQHELRKDTIVTVSGYVLVLLLMAGALMVIFRVSESELSKTYLNLTSSAVMLVLGYLFGARTRN